MKRVVRVRGACMVPVLEDGQLVELRSGLPLPGDLIVGFEETRYVAHRVLGVVVHRRRLCVLTQADASSKPDVPIPLSEVLGLIKCPVSLRDRARALSRFRDAVGAAGRRRLLHAAS